MEFYYTLLNPPNFVSRKTMLVISWVKQNAIKVLNFIVLYACGFQIQLATKVFGKFCAI